MENKHILTSDGELYHWGIKGMKWGVRRYQNADGSLTEKGKKRYERDAREKGYDKKDGDTYYKNVGKKSRREDLEIDADRYVKEDLDRSKRVAEETERTVNKLKTANDNAMRNRPKTRADLSKMTDKELRDRINREYLERQYNDMFTPQKSNKGREYASKILETTGTIVGITGGALGIAVAIKDLLGPKT